MSIFFVKAFDRRLILNHGYGNRTVFNRGGLPHYNDIAIKNGSLNHAIAPHFERKKLSRVFAISTKRNVIGNLFKG